MRCGPFWMVNPDNFPLTPPLDVKISGLGYPPQGYTTKTQFVCHPGTYRFLGAFAQQIKADTSVWDNTVLSKRIFYLLTNLSFFFELFVLFLKELLFLSE